jgi:predicted Zn-dependent peptidase
MSPRTTSGASPNSPVPPLTKPRRARKPSLAERTLPNGLRVVAVRKPGVPLAEVRLRIPALSARPGHAARIALLADTVLTGAGGLDRAGIARAVQALGGDLSVSADADRVLLGGNVLAANLPALLAIVADVLTGAEYAQAEVATERERMVERVTIARSRPGVIASEALGLRMWGEHPYAVDLPHVEQVQASTRAQLRRLHERLLRPGGAVLVIVGDLTPNRALEQVERAFAGWHGAAADGRVPALPDAPGGPLLVIDRPGSVQSSLRLGGPALPRTDARYPALQLANLIFGGYFSSRWTENIREDKGYTYGPHSRIEHHVLGSTLLCDVEVATPVTAPALLETRYELGKIASLPVTAAEVEAVRQYAIGSLALSTATQAGLASTLAALAGAGLQLDYLLEHPVRLAAVDVEQVSAAAAEFLAPAGLTSVIVGDAQLISGPLAALGPIEA